MVATITTSKNVRTIIIFYRQCYIVEPRSIYHTSIFYDYLLYISSVQLFQMNRIIIIL
ncbi:hypothetical protein [Plasmodium yoelii yoelii]|uniref:Uncharacterized protein n=1 Tax=Plasmodium yoelii yoelii TaxID=73239 RepID=Q7RHC0_PLAYO|nr:hypothetical protein [Plasmodium yoelii yoelii]